MLPLALIGAAVSAAGGIGSTLLQGNLNKEAAEYNWMRANQAQAVNMQNWYRQQAYNSPTAQVARLKAAGLNPAIAYGGNGSVVGNADQAPQLDYSGAQLAAPSVSNGIAAAGSLVQRGIESQVAGSQINNLDADIRLKESSAARQDAETSTLLEKLPYLAPLLQNHIATSLAQQNLYYKKADEAIEQTNLYAAQRKLVGEQSEAIHIMNEIQRTAKQNIIDSYGLNNEKLRAEIAETRKKLSVYDAEIEKCKWACNLMYEQSTSLAEARWNIDLEGEKIKAAIREINATVENLNSKTGINKLEIQHYMFNKCIPLLTAGVVSVGHVASTAIKAFSPVGKAEGLSDFAKSIMSGTQSPVKQEPFVIQNPLAW